MKALRIAAAVGAAVAMIAAMGPASAFVTQPIALDASVGEGRPGIDQFGNIRHVANIGDNIGWSGSDIEFASREVVKLSGGATGDPVCETDANGDCLLDADGNEIYQTEIRDFAIAGGYGQAARIIDITDPESPVHVNNTPCSISQNDIQITGDLLLVAADGNGTCKRPDGSNAGFAGTAILDFSDPRDPTYLSRLQYTRGSHNHTVHPGGRYVYLSDSDLNNAGLGNVPIWDIADPANPVLVTEFKHLVHSPHDITFNADGSRAYAAAVSATYILNTEDPRSPVLVATIANEGISIAHQSDPTPDGNYLLVSDELGGGAAGVSPGGPVHVYDIRNEATPVKIGIIENNCVQQTCHSAAEVPVSTAHMFRINPDGWTMAIAWYKDGIFVVDYSSMIGGNLENSGQTGVGPRVIAGMRMPGANSWAAKMWQERHPGYVFVNDISRGFDIFHVPELDDGYFAMGTIQAAHILNFEAAVGVTRAEFEQSCEYAPRSNGVDGWVQAIPSELADGEHDIKVEATATTTGDWDIDLYYYDANCGLIEADEDESTFETGTIPAGAKYVMAAAWTSTEDALLRVRFSTI